MTKKPGRENRRSAARKVESVEESGRPRKLQSQPQQGKDDEVDKHDEKGQGLTCSRSGTVREARDTSQERGEYEVITPVEMTYVGQFAGEERDLEEPWTVVDPYLTF